MDPASPAPDPGTPGVDDQFVSTGGLPRPEVIVTRNQVENGKPAPDSFLLAAERLGVDPAYGSGPVGTVIQDLLSIAIYLATATVIVG